MGRDKTLKHKKETCMIQYENFYYDKIKFVSNVIKKSYIFKLFVALKFINVYETEEHEVQCC